MFSKIIATGSYLPEKIITNADLEKMVDTTNEWIVERTGIRERRIVAENEKTSDIACYAAQKALEKAKLNPKDIDVLVLATTTPDLTFPSTATIVQAKLGMENGYAFDIQAVCSGFVYGLSVADSLIIAKRAKRVLIIGAEVFSRILDWTDRNTCVLFGDGAGAVILEATEDNPINTKASGIWGVNLHSDGRYTESLKADKKNDAINSLGYVTMKGQEVFKHAVVNLASCAQEILQQFNLQAEQIDWLVPHQANYRIISSTAKKLNLPLEKVIITLDKHANTSAASVPLALDTALASNKIQPGDLCLLEAMGGGFTWGSAIVRI